MPKRSLQSISLSIDSEIPKIRRKKQSRTDESSPSRVIGKDEDLQDSAIASPTPNFWLLKSEPDEYSIDDLAQSPNSSGFWDVSLLSMFFW